MWIDAEEGAFCVCESTRLWDHHMETAPRFFYSGGTDQNSIPVKF